MKSHVTEAELAAINASHLDFTNSPAIIRGVSQSQFSVARHYGGCRAHGTDYVYVPPSDELIRADVIKLLAKIRKESARKKKAEMTEKQQTLFG